MMFSCVAVCCSVLQLHVSYDCICVCERERLFVVFVTMWCSVLQCVALCGSVWQCVAVCCSELHCVAVFCKVMQCVAVCCSCCRTRDTYS